MKTLVRLAPLLAALATVGCDRITKGSAVAWLSGVDARSFLHDTLRLQLVTNSGAFLSVGASWPPALRFVVLGVGSGVLLAGLAVVAIRGGWPRVAQLGAALIVSGGLSNLIDRLATGAVVDFLNVGIGPLRTGIFNVADVAILLGGVLIAVENLRHPSRTSEG
jgi:signal peptidase II